MADTSSSDKSMAGKRVLITGANTGMGKVNALAMARLGAEVILGCRSAERGEAARAEIAAATGNKDVSVLVVDLSRRASIEAAAEKFLAQHASLDVLINNAAGWWLDRRESTDGVELQWATNVLGPQLLTDRLLGALEKSGHGRIVNIASTAAGGLDLADVEWKTRKYSGASAYSATKQANRMITWALAKRLRGRPVVVNALSPGLVATELNRNTTGGFALLFKVLRLFARDAERGADTANWLAASPEVEGQTDQFYVDRKVVKCKFRDEASCDRLWDLVQQQIAAPASSKAASGAA